METTIQGSIVTTSSPNAQEVPGRKEEVNPVIAETRSSSWKIKYQPSWTMRTALRIISMMKIDNDGI